MITKAGIGIVVLAAVVFGVSFAGTVATRRQPAAPTESKPVSAVARWLELDAEQAKIIDARDADFAADHHKLQDRYSATLTALAAIFEDVSATDEQIRQRVELVIEAHNKLERRVADHVIAIRDHLTPDQQQRLFGLCAEGVRRCGQRRGCGWAGCKCAPKDRSTVPSCCAAQGEKGKCPKHTKDPASK